MQLMSQGDTWELYVPPQMAYGDAGRSSQQRGQYIPPGAALVFVLTIVSIKGPTRAQLMRPTSDTVPALAHATVCERSAKSSPASDARTAAPTPTGDETPQAPPNESLHEVLHEMPNETPSEVPPMMDPPAVHPPPPVTPTLPSAVSVGGWLGSLFERPTLSKHTAVPVPPTDATPADAAPADAAPSDAAPAHAAPAHAGADEAVGALGAREGAATIAATDARSAALEVVHRALLELRLPTLKQALSDLGVATDGGKATLAQRLGKRLTQEL